MKRIYIAKKETKKVSAHTVLLCTVAFLLGCLATASVLLYLQAGNASGASGGGQNGQRDQFQQQQQQQNLSPLPGGYNCPTTTHELNVNNTSMSSSSSSSSIRAAVASRSLDTHKDSAISAAAAVALSGNWPMESDNSPLQVHAILQNVRILVAIAAFDFSQIPHLEEVLDSYHDVCIAGAAAVDVVIHATVAYPVTLIDLWNTRFPCENFSLTIALKPKSLRLHLVDCHRALFYEKIDQYDVFIYTEDDIRVTPTTVATYLYETARLAVAVANHETYKPSDFNVGIVRYEYNYPAAVIIDDNTRHATQNVTRVYWEHSGFERPVVPNAIREAVSEEDPLSQRYFSMRNHHQGMFLATRSLLLAWKERCNFHVASNRPGKGSQPSEGTQRVWMSSQMLYGSRHCAVLQMLPKERAFGALTVWHLPNKNYRRVGKYRNRVFADGTETFSQPHESLLSAMEFHLAMRQAWPPEPQIPYRGIRMVDEVEWPKDRTPLLDRRMIEYHQYVDRGGVLSEVDFTRVDLVEDE